MFSRLSQDRHSISLFAFSRVEQTESGLSTRIVATIRDDIVGGEAMTQLDESSGVSDIESHRVICWHIGVTAELDE